MPCTNFCLVGTVQALRSAGCCLGLKSFLNIHTGATHTESQDYGMVWVGRDLRAYHIPTPTPRTGTPSTRPGDAKLPSSTCLPPQVGGHPARNCKGVKARMKDARIFQKQPKVEDRKISCQTTTYIFYLFSLPGYLEPRERKKYYSPSGRQKALQIFYTCNLHPLYMPSW